MGKGLRKTIPSTTTSRATRKVQRVFVDLSGKKAVASINGSRYAMIVRDDFTRYSWLYFLRHKSDASAKFEQFLSDVRGHGDVECVRSDNGGEFTSRAFTSICNRHRIKQEFTTADSAMYNGVAERGLGIIETTAMAGRIEAPLLFPGANVPSGRNL